MAAPPPPPKRRRKNQGGDVSESSPVEGSSPVVVFAHGAGAPSTSEWMIRWKEMLEKALGAVEVITFDYPYISGGKRRAPPKAEKLVEYHLDIVKKAAAKYPGHPLILAGKSMGSRVSCMLAGADEIQVSAIICLGYPLKGSKDGLCPLDKLATVRKKMKCESELHVVDGGDHSFKIGKKHLSENGINQAQAEELAVKSIGEFTSKIIRRCL